jgi:hypothetical protein
MSEEAVVEATDVAVETEVTTDVVADVATEAPVATEAVSEDLAFSDQFISKIESDELKGHKTLGRLQGKSADELAQYITELQAWNGKKGDIPAKDAPQEEIDAFQIKMGRPENIEGYDFNIGEEFSELVGTEQLPYYQSKIDGFKEQALKEGMSADSAANMMEWYFDQVAGDVTGVSDIATKNSEANQATIDKEWGDGKASMEGAINAMLTKAGADVDSLKASGALSDPAIAIPLGKIASDLADDPEIGHHMTRSLTGLQDQLGEVTAQYKEYIANGEAVPAHIKAKRMSLMEKLGDDI